MQNRTRWESKQIEEERVGGVKEKPCECHRRERERERLWTQYRTLPIGHNYVVIHRLIEMD